MKFKAVIFFLFFSTWSARAATPDSLTSKGKTKWQALPTFFYTPQTNFGFGGVLLHYFEPTDTNTKASSSQWYISGTLNKQFRFESDFNVFMNQNKYYIRGKHELSLFPEFYFGLGNRTRPEDACLINYQIFDFSSQVYRRVAKDMFLGLAIHHQSLRDIMKVEMKGSPFTYSKYSSTGLGVEYLWDKRDFILNPHNGHFLELGVSGYAGNGVSRTGFAKAFLDARLYRTFGKGWVTNWNWYQEHNWRQVPFRLLPVIGGPHFLRGYYKGRFRDNNLHVFQAEIRKNVFWRIGVAAFAGIGQTFEKVVDYQPDMYHYSFGGGLRIRLDEESKANIRIDYGRTRDSDGLYLVYAEAF